MLANLAYRFQQFWFGMTASYGKGDEAFAHSYLNPEEIGLFNQLPGFEKKHAVVVARKMLELALYNPELEPQKLVKLGLLHDIGKVAERNSILTKSWLVIFRFFFPGLYAWLAEQGKTNRLWHRYYIHKHHGAIGAEMLARLGESSEIVLMVKKHDPRVGPFTPDDPIELKLLQQADSTY